MTIYNIYYFSNELGQPYVGFTSNYKKRIRQHKNKHNIIESRVLYQTKDIEHAYSMEEYFISEYDSFCNGLNKTKDGRGVYGELKSTTGFKFSIDSKKKMSDSAKLRYRSGNNPLINRKFTEKDLDKMSVSQKDIHTSLKLSPHKIIEIKRLYIIKPFINRDSKELKNKSKKALFVKIMAKVYKVSQTCIQDILKNKSYLSPDIKQTAKLTYKDAEEIRLKYKTTNLDKLLSYKQKRPYDRAFANLYSKRFNVSNTLIMKIINGDVWDNIKVSLNSHILTPNGKERFDGIVKNKYTKYYIVSLKDGTSIKCSHKHRFLTSSGEYIKAQNLTVLDSLQTINGSLDVCSVDQINEHIYLYDIINSGKNHCYFTNGIVSHNCAFVSNKGTLIQSEILESLRPREPISEVFGMSLFNGIRGKRIGLSVDVGTGTGQDYSVIQLFDLDTFEHIGEFSNNTMNLTTFTKQIIKILEYVDKQGAKEIFYTVEANSIGQGVVQLLHNSEMPVLKKAEFISGSGKQLGIMTTTKSKMKGCTKFKDLIEGEGMKIHSKNLISELKFFVKTGVSFAAESGKNDDLVMGCVLFCLMVEEIGKYDADVYDKLNDSSIVGLLSDDEDDPLPFVF